MPNKLNMALPISSVNHISFLCSSVEKSLTFYERVLGFIPIRRPRSFDFHGAWLFNYGIGIHLIQARKPNQVPKKLEINPEDNHISFHTESEEMQQVEDRLKDLGVKYIKVKVEEGGILVDQIFFHDPDGFMIEVCTCENLPLIPLRLGPCAVRETPAHFSDPLATMAFKMRGSASNSSSSCTHSD